MTDREARAALWRSRLAEVAKARSDVAEEYGLDVADLEGISRRPPAPEARREVMTRLWERGLSLSEIGRLLGRDPSTVCSAVQKSMGDTYKTMSAGPGRVRSVRIEEKKESA